MWLWRAIDKGNAFKPDQGQPFWPSKELPPPSGCPWNVHPGRHGTWYSLVPTALFPHSLFFSKKEISYYGYILLPSPLLPGMLGAIKCMIWPWFAFEEATDSIQKQGSEGWTELIYKWSFNGFHNALFLFLKIYREKILGEGFCFHSKKQNILVFRESIWYSFSIVLV